MSPSFGLLSSSAAGTDAADDEDAAAEDLSDAATSEIPLSAGEQPVSITADSINANILLFIKTAS
jgi:hypothetical protein